MNVPAFLSYIVLTAITPGPNNIMAMTNASKGGLRAGMRYCCGMFFGFIAVLSACAAFTSLLYSYIPRIEPVMKWIGAAYILFLAWVVFRDKPHAEKKHRLRPDSVLTGMLMQFVNVKCILYGITVMSVYILPNFRSIPAIALAVVGLSVNAFICTTLWALFGSVFQRIFTEHKKALNIVMSLLLVYCAVSTVFF